MILLNWNLKSTNMKRTIILHYPVPEFFVQMCREKDIAISNIKIVGLFKRYIEEMIRDDTMEFFIEGNL